MVHESQITARKISKIINKCIKHRNEPFHGGMGSTYCLSASCWFFQACSNKGGTFFLMGSSRIAYDDN